jgi:hypothetical protein
MSVKLDLSGFDDFQRKLERIRGEHDLKAEDLFPDDFVRQYISFHTRRAFFEAGGVKGKEDTETDAFSQFVSANTRFPNWFEMLKRPKPIGFDTRWRANRSRTLRIIDKQLRASATSTLTWNCKSASIGAY